MTIGSFPMAGRNAEPGLKLTHTRLHLVDRITYLLFGVLTYLSSGLGFVESWPGGRACHRAHVFDFCLASSSRSASHHTSHDFRQLPHGRAKCRTGAHHLRSNTQLATGKHMYVLGTCSYAIGAERNRVSWLSTPLLCCSRFWSQRLRLVSMLSASTLHPES